MKLDGSQNPMKRPEVRAKHLQSCLERNRDPEYIKKLRGGCRRRSLNKAYCEKLAKPRIKKVIVWCNNCGKELKRYPSQIEPHNFCDHNCHDKWQRGKSNLKNSKPKIIKNCMFCGRVFNVTPSRKDARFCSLQCRNKHYSGIVTGFLSGEKHWNWKGGYEPYYGPNWESQRKRALERDNYHCRICGSNNRLAVHHIIPFREFGLLRYKEANQLSNLVTLCNSHHSRMEVNECEVQIQRLA